MTLVQATAIADELDQAAYLGEVENFYAAIERHHLERLDLGSEGFITRRYWTCHPLPPYGVPDVEMHIAGKRVIIAVLMLPKSLNEYLCRI